MCLCNQQGNGNSGVADLLAGYIIDLSRSHGPYILLAVLFIITNIFTELITNNAAAALSFPLALSLSQQLGVNPMPFFVVICMAASASFSTPIGYQTNLIVQGIGTISYRFCTNRITIEYYHILNFCIRHTSNMAFFN